MRGLPKRDIYGMWQQGVAPPPPADSWADTLAVDPESDGNNPTITAGDRLVYDGTRAGSDVTVQLNEGTPTTPVLDVASAIFAGAGPDVSTSFRTQTGAAAGGAASGLIQFLTGAVADGGGTTGPSGGFIVSTGALTTTNDANTQPTGSVLLGSGAVSGGAGQSGELLFRSGNVTSGATGGAESGGLRMVSGDGSGLEASSGRVGMYSGSATGVSGNADVITGNTSGAFPSGNINALTGNNTGTGASGTWTAGTGDAAGLAAASGAATLRTGSAGGISGGLYFQTGYSVTSTVGEMVFQGGEAQAAATGGEIWMAGGQGVSGRGAIQIAPLLGLADEYAQTVRANSSELYPEGWDVTADRYTLSHDFDYVGVDVTTPTYPNDPMFVAIDNSTVPGASFPSDARGGVVIDCDGAASNAYLLAFTDTVWRRRQVDRTVRSRIRGVCAFPSNAGQVQVGAKTTLSTYLGSNEQVLLHFDGSVDTTWQATTTRGGVTTTTDTGVLTLVNEVFAWMISIEQNRVVYWLYDGNALRVVAIHAGNTGLTGMDLQAGWVGSPGGAARSLFVGSIRHSFDR